MNVNILSWNCNKAFRKKCGLFSDKNYDVLVIAECENPAAVQFPDFIHEMYSYRWIGDNKNSGLCVFVRKDWELKLLDDYRDQVISYVLPVKITSAKEQIALFAIWACPGDNNKFRYIGQVWLYLKKYLEKFPKNGVLLAGDFNSNMIWDNEHEEGCHTDVVRLLQSKHIESIYHTLKKEHHGAETIKTLYMYRKKDKGYHIDYCFASQDIRQNYVTCIIGEYDQWIKHSDHMPITLRIRE